MFSEYRIHPALLHLLYCLLCSAGEEVVRLQELEGNTVTIHTGLTGDQSDAQILWLYRSENVEIKIVNSLVFKGETNTDYPSERFRDRLQLNRNSGSLTITNISREDSGVYKLQIITGHQSVWSFSVNIYDNLFNVSYLFCLFFFCFIAPVSKPVIRNQAEKRSVSLRESWSPLCSVENGKDVSLSWYEEKERISSISSSDSSERLYLPLNITNPNCSTYTCVAANPVSSQTTQLDITNVCIKAGQKAEELPESLAAVLTSAGLIVALSVLFVLYWRKTSKQQVYLYVKLNYTEVKSTSQYSEEDYKRYVRVKSSLGVPGHQVYNKQGGS
ncbi:CD48 antigen-like [Colossoma macropomum]|uniref:CD48 antigen-like n=1 Tax=Colossoma macropomum TaxID=42526 RepID=UPI0018647D64|nr:CD48 antigen-like [Colossoma macropomum]